METLFDEEYSHRAGPMQEAWSGLDAESGLVAAIREMLGEAGFHFPLSAASRQFREFYYGMASAALLEDVFVDAFSNFLAQRHPGVAFERSPRGEKGWDYAFQGTRVSHKVGQGPTAIAVLWDATVKRTHHSFEYPVVFVSSKYTPTRTTIEFCSSPITLQALSGSPDQLATSGDELLVVHWPTEGDARVVGSFPVTQDAPIARTVSFEDLWSVIGVDLAAGTPANEVEVLIRVGKRGRGLLRPGVNLNLSALMRPGVYVLRPQDMQDIPVTSNNRAVLVPKDAVRERMGLALRNGSVVPMTVWFQLFASGRPPDLYLSQRSEWDSRFSPAQRS